VPRTTMLAKAPWWAVPWLTIGADQDPRPR
jgi:hypothetical protein